jgi:hypothetical protein
MVFHATTEYSQTVRVQCGGDRFVRICLYRLTFEIEGNLFTSIEVENGMFCDSFVQENSRPSIFTDDSRDFRRDYAFANVEVIILHVNRMPWAGAYALPTEKTFRYVVPYGGWHEASFRRNQLVETL